MARGDYLQFGLFGWRVTPESIDGLAKNDFSEAEETIQWFKNLFGEDYYIELQRHETQNRVVIKRYMSVKNR